jgi:hypothetical protein
MAPMLTAEHLVPRIATDRATSTSPSAFGIRGSLTRSRQV